MLDHMPLKSTGWLEANLGTPELRIYDCTAQLLPDPATVFRVVSGHKSWEREHVPGAVHIDIEKDISDPNSSLRFTMPPREIFAAAMARLGVGSESLVVLYSTSHYMWASRVLWMLRDIGFTNAFLLDGGLAKWRAEGRPMESGIATYPRGQLEVRSAPPHFVDRAAVLAAIGRTDTILVNALPPGQFRGDPNETNHGRLGRIASSINIPANSLVDLETGTMLPAKQIDEIIASAGISRSEKIICYCGGGVSATCVAMALAARGFGSITVYDGSLNEWARDLNLPMEVG